MYIWYTKSTNFKESSKQNRTMLPLYGNRFFFDSGFWKESPWRTVTMGNGWLSLYFRRGCQGQFKLCSLHFHIIACIFHEWNHTDLMLKEKKNKWGPASSNSQNRNMWLEYQCTWKRAETPKNLNGHHRRLCAAPIPTPSLKWLLIQKKILMVGE